MALKLRKPKFLRGLGDDTAEQAARLKVISDALEATYQSLRQSAASISGLLQVGQATCEEVTAYNLWAQAIYNTQRGMVASLRAGGETDVTEPQPPTLFTGASCPNPAQDLSGALGRAMRGPTATTRYLSSKDVQIQTSDQYVYDPAASPTYKTLVAVQQQRAQTQGLGFAPLLLIVIAGIAVAVTVAIVAIMHYLEVNEVQEANTAKTQMQAAAYQNYLAARLQCLATCKTDDCISSCNKIAKPAFDLPGAGKWGTLQWIGFTVVAVGGVFIAVRLYKRHQAGKPMFELPDSIDDAIHPG